MKELPSNFREGRALLEKYERSKNQTERARNFVDGIDILNNVLSGISDPKHKFIIYMLKVTYTRTIIKELPKLPIKDIFEWLNYVIALMSVKDECKILFKQNQQFEKIVENFFSKFREEFFETVTL